MEVLRARKDLEDILLTIDYDRFEHNYVPTKWAYKFIAFIKLVNGSMGEENTSPLFHYDMLDQLTIADKICLCVFVVVLKLLLFTNTCFCILLFMVMLQILVKLT